MTKKLLESDLLKLRAVEPEDAALIHKWENNTENWQVSNTKVPFSFHTIKQYAENPSHDIYENLQLRLIIERKKDTKAIGALDLFDFDAFNQRAGIGILINDTEDRGKGYATDAIGIIKYYAFNFLHLKQLYCTIGEDNPKSLKLFQQCGFSVCGIREQWLRTYDGWISEYMLQCIDK